MLSKAQRQTFKPVCYIECQQYVVILKVKLICKNRLSHYLKIKETNNKQISNNSSSK